MVKRDESDAVELRDDFGSAFDDVLDEIHSNPSQQHEEPQLQLSRKERDAIVKKDRDFCAQFLAACNDHIRSAGIRVEYVGPDVEGSGYVIDAKDQGGRPLRVKLEFDEAIAAASTVDPSDIGRHLIGTVCDRLIEARKTWFKRMGIGQ